MNLIQKINFNKENICKILCSFSFLALLVSVGAQVFVSNTSAIKSNELIKLSWRRDQLDKEVTNYKHQLASVSCLSYIERLARERGFVDMEGSLLVVKPASVAAAIR